MCKDAAERHFDCSVISIKSSGSVKEFDWEFLKGRKVLLWPDADIGSVRAMNQLANLIDSNEVYMVDVTSLPKGADIADLDTKEEVQKVLMTASIVDNKLEVEGATSIKELKDRLENFQGLMSTGIAAIDEVVKLPPNGLVLIEGRTGHGKTTLLDNISLNLMESCDRPQVFFSYEIPTEQLLAKMLMIERKDPSPNMEDYLLEIKDKGLPKDSIVAKNYNKKFFVVDDKKFTIDKVVDTLRAGKLVNAVIFIDYIQLVPESGQSNSRYRKLAEDMKKVLDVALVQDQLVLLASQVTKGSTQEEDVSRESADIENTCRLIFKVWNKVAGDYNSNMKGAYTDVLGNFIVNIKKSSWGRSGMGIGLNLVGGGYITDVDPKDEIIKLQRYRRDVKRSRDKLLSIASVSGSLKKILSLQDENPRLNMGTLSEVNMEMCSRKEKFLEHTLMPILTELDQYLHVVEYEPDSKVKLYHDREAMKKVLVIEAVKDIKDMVDIIMPDKQTNYLADKIKTIVTDQREASALINLIRKVLK